MTAQNKTSYAKFKMSMLDFFVCGTPVAYLTSETEDYEDDKIASGSWSIDKGITLKLAIGMLHIIADVILFIRLTSVLEKLLQSYTDAGLALLWSQISHKFSSSQAPSRPSLQRAQRKYHRSTCRFCWIGDSSTEHSLSTPNFI